LLNNGVYMPPSPFEAAFTSAVHDQPEFQILEAALGEIWRR
jgi:glutamate-1-semialdehyde aminotransferase